MSNIEMSKLVPIDSIIPWERNPRINDHAVKHIAKSIEQFGFLNPIIVQKSSNKIVAGHTRHKGAKLLGLTEVPVIFADLDDTKAQAYAIADNKLGELASWDDSVLVELLEELKMDDFDLDTLGFDEIELADLFNDENIRELNVDTKTNEIEYDGIAKITIEIKEEEQEEIIAKIREALASYDIELR